LLVVAAAVVAIYFAAGFLRRDPAIPPTPPAPASRPVPAPGVIGEAEALRMDAAKTPQGPLVAAAGAVRNGVTGVVRDTDGAPLDDADVEFVQFDYRREKIRIFEQAVRRTVVKTVTGADGAFTLLMPEGYDLAAPGTLYAVKRGYLGQYKDWIKPGSRVDFTLSQGVPVVGRVVDEATGAPVAGAFVRGWYTTEGTRDADRAFRWQEDLKSDETGAFRFEGAPAGTVKFLAFHEDYYDYFEDRPLVPGTENRVDLRVRRGVVVAATVLDARTRKPVAGAEVIAAAGIGMPRRFATTDPEGRFRARGLEAGVVRFVVTKTGYGMQTFPLEITPRSGENEQGIVPLTIELQPSAQAAGTVRDHEGRPIAGAKIQIGQLKSVFWTVRDGPEAVTDAAGRFLVGELLPDSKYKIVALDERCVIGLGEEFQPAAGEIRDGLDVRMPRGGGVQGLVTDDSGTPVAGVDVTLSRPPFLGMTLLPGQECGQKSLATTRTDEQGRYVFAGLGAGDHGVVFDHRSFVLAEEKAVVREPDEIVTLDVKLVRGGDVSGKVTDATGAPVAKAEVRAFAPFSPTAVSVAETDAEGRYRLLRLRPGDYSVKATASNAESGAPSQDGVRPGTEGVDFRLEPFPAVTGHVVDQAGRAVSSYTLALTPIDRRPDPGSVKRPSAVKTMRAIDVKDDGGFFRVPFVDPGRYVVDLKAPGQAPTRGEEVEIRSGADQDLGQLVIRAGGRVTGVVLDDRGLPVPDVDVLLARIGGGAVPPLDPVKSLSGKAVDASFAGRTDGVGRYRLDAVAQGQYLIRFDSPRHVPSAPAQVNVMDGDETNYEARLRRSGGISLTVRNTGGEPIPHALIEVRDTDGRLIPSGKGTEKIGRTGIDGTAKLSRLPIGPLIIKLRPPGYVATDTPVTVVESEDRALMVTLEHVIR
jgi:protocatechuate 3,4-dioxygenase beta subunit